MRSITYLYPDDKNASNFKIYQERTNQIRAFYFTKESYKNFFEFHNSKTYGIYFLFDKSEDENKVYIGQSVNGIMRMDGHYKQKGFWTYGILFVTDNESFDRLTIDYLEYIFIQNAKKSSYVITNKDLKSNKPNINLFDEPRMDAYVEQIEFLLSAEGISFQDCENESSHREYYYPSKRYNAKIYVENGKFILNKGSVLQRPLESTKDWKGSSMHKRCNRIIDEYIDNEKIIQKGNDLITVTNIAFQSPSAIAELVSGMSENGWTFFKGLNSLRNK